MASAVLPRCKGAEAGDDVACDASPFTGDGPGDPSALYCPIQRLNKLFDQRPKASSPFGGCSSAWAGVSGFDLLRFLLP